MFFALSFLTTSCKAIVFILVSNWGLRKGDNRVFFIWIDLLLYGPPILCDNDLSSKLIIFFYLPCYISISLVSSLKFCLLRSFSFSTSSLNDKSQYMHLQLSRNSWCRSLNWFFLFMFFSVDYCWCNLYLPALFWISPRFLWWMSLRRSLSLSFITDLST